MKKGKSKSVSRVKSKKEKGWKIFSKENLKWGLGGLIILTIISLGILNNLCPSKFPLGNICLSNISFVIINFFGLIVLGAIYWKSIGAMSLDNFLKLSIFINLPIFYLIGIIFRKIFNKIKK